MILELIGQSYFDLKQNNSTNVWNKCLINCFRIDSLSSNLRDKPHMSMQHCFHVVFCIIGTQYLHFRHPGKDSHSELVFNSYISNHNKMRRPRPKLALFKFLFIFLLFLNQCYSNKLWKHQKKNTKNYLW